MAQAVEARVDQVAQAVAGPVVVVEVVVGVLAVAGVVLAALAAVVARQGHLDRGVRLLVAAAVLGVLVGGLGALVALRETRSRQGSEIVRATTSPTAATGIPAAGPLPAGSPTPK